jgi:hypothetical protein
MKPKQMTASEARTIDLSGIPPEHTAKRNLGRYALLVWRIYSRRPQESVDRKRVDR